MSLPNLWNRVLRGRASSHRRRQTHRQPARLGRSFVPRLEPLEDRTVPRPLAATAPAAAMVATAPVAGTFAFDSAMVIADNHASTSNDDGFGY